MPKRWSIAKPSNQWFIVCSPTSHFAGPVRTSAPCSQSGSRPSRPRRSTRVSRSSDSKPAVRSLVVAGAMGWATWLIFPPEWCNPYGAYCIVSWRGYGKRAVDPHLIRPPRPDRADAAGFPIRPETGGRRRRGTVLVAPAHTALFRVRAARGGGPALRAAREVRQAAAHLPADQGGGGGGRPLARGTDR